MLLGLHLRMKRGFMFGIFEGSLFKRSNMAPIKECYRFELAIFEGNEYAWVIITD